MIINLKFRHLVSFTYICYLTVDYDMGFVKRQLIALIVWQRTLDMSEKKKKKQH